MSLSTAQRVGTCACFPRVSGDEPTVYTSGIKKTAFSPRERG